MQRSLILIKTILVRIFIYDYVYASPGLPVIVFIEFFLNARGPNCLLSCCGIEEGP